MVFHGFGAQELRRGEGFAQAWQLQWASAMRIHVCKVLLLGLSSCLPKPVPKSLPVREELPVEAYEVLSARMERHGDQMSALMMAVTLLDYEVVGLLARRMLEEPGLGRPVDGDKQSLNALLPASFFVHQDALHEATRGLADAAQARDDMQLVKSFTAVATSCVACHSAYLHEALTEQDWSDDGAYEPTPSQQL